MTDLNSTGEGIKAFFLASQSVALCEATHTYALVFTTVHWFQLWIIREEIGQVQVHQAQMTQTVNRYLLNK